MHSNTFYSLPVYVNLYIHQFQACIDTVDNRIRSLGQRLLTSLNPWIAIQQQLPSRKTVYTYIRNALGATAGIGFLLSLSLWGLGRKQVPFVICIFSCVSLAGTGVAHQASSLAHYSEIADNLQAQVALFQQTNQALSQQLRDFSNNNTDLKSSMQTQHEEINRLQETNTELQHNLSDYQSTTQELRLQIAHYTELLQSGRDLLREQATGSSFQATLLERFTQAIQRTEQVRTELIQFFQSLRDQHAEHSQTLVSTMQQVIQKDMAEQLRQSENAKKEREALERALKMTETSFKTALGDLENTHKKLSHTAEKLEDTEKHLASTRDSLSTVLEEVVSAQPSPHTSPIKSLSSALQGV